MRLSKLHPVALGASFGIISGVMVLGMALLAQVFLDGKPIVAALGTMYISYNTSLINSLLVGVYAFANGFVGGYVVAWIYNFLIDRLLIDEKSS